MLSKYGPSAVLVFIYAFMAAFILSECLCNDNINIVIMDRNQTEMQVQVNALQIRQLNLEVNNILDSLSELRQHIATTVPTTSDYQPPQAPFGCETIGSTHGSDVYRIRGSITGDPFYAFCQADTSSNSSDQQRAWTMILQRSDDQTSFYRDWKAYENGFGNVAGDHWIGLKRLHMITAARRHELLVELEDFDGQKRFASYTSFAVADKENHFAMNVLGKYTGTAGDGLRYHAGYKFSTFDADHDIWSSNCAKERSGAGWYKGCSRSNLFGLYLEKRVSTENEAKGIYWKPFCDIRYSLRHVRMMIRALE